MGNLFHKKSRTTRVTEQDRAILQLKEQRDRLQQYQRRVHASLSKDRMRAKALLAEGKKDRALLLLRVKRYQEGLLANTDKQLSNVMQLTSDIEFAQLNVAVVDGLKMGNAALKQLNDSFSLDEIERIMEESRDSCEKQEEINALISGVLTTQDEDDVLAELEQLEMDADQAVENADQPASIAFNLPDVPTTNIEVGKTRAKERMLLAE